MPKLIWKLKDPKSCQGCPELEKDYNCIPKRWLCAKGYKSGEAVSYTPYKKPKRPQACIKELGE